MQTSAQLIPEFIQALQEEIDVLKRGKGSSSIKVFNGSCTVNIRGFYLSISFRKPLAVVDDTC